MGLDAAQRRQQLVVGDVEADLAQARGEGLRCLVAAVREDGERPAGGADLREHLERARLHVRLLACPLHERPVDVEHEPAARRQVARRHTTRSSPFCTRSCVIDLRFATSWRSVTTGWPSDRTGGGARGRRRADRVHLLLRHRQPQQQLLVGDPRAEALARALEVQRLEVAQLLGARPREHALGDLRRERRGRVAVVAEEVADGLVGDVRPALAVDHVPHRLGGDHLRDRRDDDRVAHLRPHPADLLEHLVEQLRPAELAEHPPRRRDHAARELVVVVGRVELLRPADGQPLLAAELAEVRRDRGERVEVEPVREALGLEVPQASSRRPGSRSRARAGRRPCAGPGSRPAALPCRRTARARSCSGCAARPCRSPAARRKCGASSCTAAGVSSPPGSFR